MWRDHWRTHRSNPGPHTGCGARRCASAPPARNGLAGLARPPGARAPTPPAFTAWPTSLMPMRRTLLRFGHRRAGRAVWSRCPRATRWKWIWRPRCGRTLHPPARPRPARVAPWAAPHTAAHEPLHALTPWAFALRRISTRTRRGRHSKRTRASGMRNNREGGLLRRKSAHGRSSSRPRAAQGLCSPQRGWR